MFRTLTFKFLFLLSYTTFKTLLCLTTYYVDCVSQTWLKPDTDFETSKIPHSLYHQKEGINFSLYSINATYQTIIF